MDHRSSQRNRRLSNGWALTRAPSVTRGVANPMKAARFLIGSKPDARQLQRLVLRR
jgi:hypothetical protein